VRAAAVCGIAVLLSGCSAAGPDQQSTAASRAAQLVSSAHSAGVAPGLTPDVAESLYGTSAPQVCDALDDGVGSAESLLLLGNPAGRRAKVISTDAITYGRLVVQAYCPDQLSTYDDLVSGVDGVATTT
jgi:hypothetical protein